MILNRIRKWWKRRHFNLRQACVDLGGRRIIKKKDSLCQGIPIGGFLETIGFIDMVEKVKKENGIE